MSRKLTRQTIKPVLHHVRVNVNSGFYKFYHFTLDYYNDKPSFSGGSAYDLDECYMAQYNPGTFERLYTKPMDEYALDLTTGDVIRLADKITVMTVEMRR